MKRTALFASVAIAAASPATASSPETEINAANTLIIITIDTEFGPTAVEVGWNGRPANAQLSAGIYQLDQSGQPFGDLETVSLSCLHATQVNSALPEFLSEIRQQVIHPQDDQWSQAEAHIQEAVLEWFCNPDTRKTIEDLSFTTEP